MLFVRSLSQVNVLRPDNARLGIHIQMPSLLSTPTETHSAHSSGDEGGIETRRRLERLERVCDRLQHWKAPRRDRLPEGILLASAWPQ